MALLVRKQRERCDESFSLKSLWPKCFKFCLAIYKLSKPIFFKNRKPNFNYFWTHCWQRQIDTAGHQF